VFQLLKYSAQDILEG
jgi:hypothetical protein